MAYRYGQAGAKARGDAKRRARMNSRWQRAVAYSVEGMAKAEAAQALGLTISGLKSLCRAKTGSQRWPINVEEAKW